MDKLCENGWDEVVFKNLPNKVKKALYLTSKHVLSNSENFPTANILLCNSIVETYDKTRRVLPWNMEKFKKNFKKTENK